MKITNVMGCLLCGAMALSFTACGSDDDEPNVGGGGVESVFPAGVPASIDGAKITTNAAGQVTKIEDEYAVAEFKYGSFTRATTYQVMLTQYDKSNPNEKSVIYMQLNAQGYASRILETYSDSNETDSFEFGYNADGQLTSMKRSEGDNEVTTITYTNGNITKVSVKDDESTTPDVTEFSYTSAKVTTPIVNKGGIMFFDSVFDVDLDEMEIAYYAGLLGKATKNLPVGSKDGDYTSTFTWTLNAEQLPIKMVATYSWSTEYSDTYEIKW